MRVEKGWGHEEIWAAHPDYCGKNLVFNQGCKFSMHFHAVKDETWRVLSGSFRVKWIDTKDASHHEEYLEPGAVWHNPPLMPHQLECIEAGTIIEVSTYDDPDDNYRVAPGDSQR